MVSLERNIQLFCLLRAFVEVFRGSSSTLSCDFHSPRNAVHGKVHTFNCFDIWRQLT